MTGSGAIIEIWIPRCDASIRLYGPGIFTTVETLPNGTIRLHPTCTMDDDKLAAMWSEIPDG